MGHFIGIYDRQVYVHDDGTIWANDLLRHFIADNYVEYLNRVEEEMTPSLIVTRLPDENGEINYEDGIETESSASIDSFTDNKCGICGLQTKSKAGLAVHKYFAHREG